MRVSHQHALKYLVDLATLALLIGAMGIFYALMPPDSIAMVHRVLRYGHPFPCRSNHDGGLPHPGCIRLGRVRKDGTGIALTMEKFLLDEAPPYRALSYTWGPAQGLPEDSEPLQGYVGYGPEKDSIVNDPDHSVSVSRNLVGALERIVDLDEDEWYWIDSLCIDQENPRERSEQVGNMHNIYQRAHTVDVWLGRSSDRDAAHVTEVLRYLAENGDRWGNIWTGPGPNGSSRSLTEDSLEYLTERDWEALASFLSRRWFHRLWVLQEVALANQVRVMYGRHFIDHKLLVDAALFLFSHTTHMDLQYGRYDIAGAAVVQQALLRESLHDINKTSMFLPSFVRDRQCPEYEELLVWLYWRSASTFASDPRDYVYGLVGLANALMDRLRQVRAASGKPCPEYSPIQPDYSLPTPDVYYGFITRLIRANVGVRAMSLVPMPFQGKMPKHRKLRRNVHPWVDEENKLPSWVPNLAHRDSFPLSTGGAMKPYNESHSLVNVFGSRARTDFQRAFINERKLHVFGHRLGVIRSRGRPLPFEFDVETCTEFGLNAIGSLKYVSQNSCLKNRLPTELFLLNYMIGDGDQTDTVPRKSPLAADAVENLLAAALSIYVCIQMKDGGSIDSFLSTDDSFQSALSIQNVSHNFLTNVTRRWREPETAFEWSDWRRCFSSTAEYANIGDICKQVISSSPQGKGRSIFALSLEHKESQVLCHKDGSATDEPSRLLGIGPDITERNDEIWILEGSEWPVVLRPLYDSNENTTRLKTKSYEAKDTMWFQQEPTQDVDVYRFVGETYIYGISNGELFPGENYSGEFREIVIQ